MTTPAPAPSRRSAATGALALAAVALSAAVLPACAGGSGPAPAEPAAAPAPPPAAVPTASSDAAAGGREGELLIYSVFTGHTPLYGGAQAGRFAGPVSEEEREASLEGELARKESRSVDPDDAAERRRQSELQSEIAGREAPLPEVDEQAPESLRVAVAAPVERDVPTALLSRTPAELDDGGGPARAAWRESLDADGDGHAELVRWSDRESGDWLRAEEDRDSDGVPDVWRVYEAGELTEERRDTNGDGRPDRWDRFADGRATERAIDRDLDGTRDAVYRYRDASLAEETEDRDFDGSIDRRVLYREGQRARAEEDLDGDGWMDLWTTYRVVDDTELVARVERDTLGTGRPTVIEVYYTDAGRSELDRRDEDLDGDGAIDVTSTYENGKLVRREVRDPTLAPL